MSEFRLLLAIWLCTVLSPVAYASNNSVFFTGEQLRRISPRASDELVSVLVNTSDEITAAGIRRDLRATHFLVQLLTETGGLRRIDEDMNYSAKRLQEVFKIDFAIAQQLAGRPRETANYVYGNKLGNRGRNTDDGWQFRGSGYIQLTGRYNFRKRGKEILLPLEEQPELARHPKGGLLAAIAYWSAHDINSPADRNDLKTVRARINPVLEGYGASRAWLRRVQGVLLGQESGAPTTLDQPSAQDDIADALRELGYLRPGGAEAATETELSEALRSFQKSRSLPETGKIDDDTFYELTDPKEWKGRTGSPNQRDNTSPFSLPTKDRRAGVSYDLNTRVVRLVDTLSSSQVTSTTEGQQGSGVQQTSSQLSPTELSALNNVDPLFAPYEERSGIRDAQNVFVPFSVIDPDSRTVVERTASFPFRAIAYISFAKFSGSGRYGCSGAFISRNVVLTAGHCVHDGSKAGDWHRDFVIVPARNGPIAPFGSCSATALYSVRGWIEAESSAEARLNDIGAIRLNCDVGNVTGWFSMGAMPDVGAPVSAIIHGYPCDKTPVGKQWKSEGIINLVTPTKLFYENDTYGCMSGAPISTQRDDTIVAVHTNGLHGEEPWNSYNAGTRLNDDLISSLKRWIED